MIIRILGAHNRESSYTRCTSMIIDDTLVIDAGGLTAALSVEAQQDIEALLLTHEHYDHTRDVPSIAMNYYTHMDLFHSTEQLNIYSTERVRDLLTKHLLNGEIYPDFTARPAGNPALRFNVIEPDKNFDAAGYTVLPVSVYHRIPSLGYQVTDSGGSSIFYTGDTGPGLTEVWRKIGTPQVIISEVTWSNGREEQGKRAGHLTPNLLKQELTIFKEMKGYLPRVFAVHMTPEMEDDIKVEVEQVAAELKTTILPTYEGMQINL